MKRKFNYEQFDIGDWVKITRRNLSMIVRAEVWEKYRIMRCILPSE